MTIDEMRDWILNASYRHYMRGSDPTKTGGGY